MQLVVGGDHAGFHLKAPRAYLVAEFSTDEEFRRRVAKLGDLERMMESDAHH